MAFANFDDFNRTPSLPVLQIHATQDVGRAWHELGAALPSAPLSPRGFNPFKRSTHSSKSLHAPCNHSLPAPHPSQQPYPLLSSRHKTLPTQPSKRSSFSAQSPAGLGRLPKKPPSRRVSLWAAFPHLESHNTHIDTSSAPSQPDPATNRHSVLGRLQRRLSRRSAGSQLLASHHDDHSVSSASPSSDERRSRLSSRAGAKVVSHGTLKNEASGLKTSWNGYLVLTEEHLLRFSTAIAAYAVFSHLAAAINSANEGDPDGRIQARKEDITEGACGPIEEPDEISLERIISIFQLDESNKRFGVEVCWSEPYPVLGYAVANFYFAHAPERDDWLRNIRHFRETMRERCPTFTLVSDNVETRITAIVTETEFEAEHRFLDICPVAWRARGSRPPAGSISRRSQSSNGTQNLSPGNRGEAVFLVRGSNLCYLMRIARSTTTTPPDELDVKVESFGLASLYLFRASVVGQEERFVLGFRVPFRQPTYLELASRYCRAIICSFMAADRFVRPAWPQRLQRNIFDVRGAASPLQLTAGEDLGGLRRSLSAYYAAFGCDPVDWEVGWQVLHPPEFRLKPCSAGATYSNLQLIAVLRALRYNDYFKSISFRDVHLHSLAHVYDLPGYHDTVADTSRRGKCLDDEHSEAIRLASVLSQELHAVVFTSGAVRSLDLTNVLASGKRTLSATADTSMDDRYSRQHTRSSSANNHEEHMSLLQSMSLLWQKGLCHCDHLFLGGNPLGPQDVGLLVSSLQSEQVKIRSLDLSNCSLDDDGLFRIWSALQSQADTLTLLDLSGNPGSADLKVIDSTLGALSCIEVLNIAGNIRNTVPPTTSLTKWSSLSQWNLSLLDLSSIKINRGTVRSLVVYLKSQYSTQLKSLCLNNCGVTGDQASQLLSAAAPNRQLTMHLSENPLEHGVDQLCEMLAHEGSCGPRAVFMDMIEFDHEADYVKLIKALTLNGGIRLLSLVGTGPIAPIGLYCLDALSNLLEKNTRIRYLDLSGYRSKLHEGQLGRLFPRALRSLLHNKALAHVRITNQMLDTNVSELAAVLAENTSLLTLDVGDNNFGPDHLATVADSLRLNSTLLRFRSLSNMEMANSSRLLAALEHRREQSAASTVATRSRNWRRQKTAVVQQHQAGGYDKGVRASELSHIILLKRNSSRHIELHDPEDAGDAELARIFGGLAYAAQRRRALSLIPSTTTATATHAYDPNVSGMQQTRTLMRAAGLDYGFGDDEDETLLDFWRGHKDERELPVLKIVEYLRLNDLETSAA